MINDTRPWITDTYSLRIEKDDYGEECLHNKRYGYRIVGFGQNGERLGFVFGSGQNKEEIRSKVSGLAKEIRSSGDHPCSVILKNQVVVVIPPEKRSSKTPGIDLRRDFIGVVRGMSGKPQ
jgi:hypothetical protein